MQNVSTEGATSAATPTVNANPERTAALATLFTANYSHVMDAASGPGLSAGDIDRLVSATARHLDSYTGELQDESFRVWIVSHLEAAAELIGAHLSLKASYRKVVLKGIWSVVAGCADLGIDDHTVPTIESDVWLKIFEDRDEWMAPGVSSVPGGKPAKLSTRLFAKARMEARSWKTDRLRDRVRFVDNEDAAKVERLSFDKEYGYGRYYPQSMRPRPAQVRENLLPVVIGDAPLLDANVS